MSAESAKADKLIGQVLANRYQILHRLGEGAMGVVYKARHVKVGRSFAVKILHPRLLEDPKLALRFDREAELAGRLRHANVVGVVDVGELDGMRYMVMDFAEGPDLARLLVEAPMPPDRIIRLVRQMLEGLYHAHEQGLIHRDFKPENVIIERDTHGAEMPRIVDFGIAILRDGGETANGQGRLTTNGLVLGTPHYMAPEQAVADPIDHRIDLFALGIVIYEMLCGRLPFDGSGAEVARANLLLDPPAISVRVPHLEVDPLLEAFSRRLMAKKRSARPATAKAARELLDLIDRDRPAAAAALGLPASAYMPGVTQPVPPQRRDSPHVEPAPVETTRLKATPSPSQPVAPVAQTAPPFTSTPSPFQSAPPPFQPTPPPFQPTPPPFQPPPFESAPFQSGSTLPPGPIAFSAPYAPGAPNASQSWGGHEQAIQTPLGWPSVPTAKRRSPWIIAGLALGTAGVFAVLLFARTGAKQATPAAGDVVATTPIGSNATSTGAMPTPAVADPKPIDPRTADPKAIDPTAVDANTPNAAAPQPTDPKPTDLKPTDPQPTAPQPTAPQPTDPKPTDLKPTDLKPTDPKASPKQPAKWTAPRDTKTHESNTTAPKVHDTKATGASPVDETAADPKAGSASTSAGNTVGPRSAGISGNSLSDLYSDVGKQLKQLPADKSQDLWGRYLLFHMGALMSAPQADRDKAAAELKQILAEATRRSH